MTKLEKLEKIRELKIRQARLDFWEYCRLEDPEFYSDKHSYLKEFARTLQAFYERRIVRVGRGDPDNNYGWFVSPVIRPELECCRRLIVNFPPRHGKTRTVQLFYSWALGVDPTNRIICGSFNDGAADDISRAVQNKISEKATSRWRVIYNEVFPETKLKPGDSSVRRWAIQGRHFSFLTTGPGGSATGKGASILGVDDPIKSAEEAFNANEMQKRVSWIVNTLLSRMEGDALFLLIQTRWPGGDPAEEALNGKNANLYYVFSLKAHLGNGIMLNPDILDYETFSARMVDTDESIFMANYQQEIVTPRNALYGEFRTYTELPRDSSGKTYQDAIIAYCDTADGGGDFTTGLTGYLYDEYIYVTDVFYRCLPSEEAIPEIGNLLIRNETREAMFESNSGGKAFAKAVDQYIRERHFRRPPYIQWFHQSANKISRILTNAAAVQRRVIFPLDWKTRWPEYAKAMTSYVRVGRNKNDDAPDATTGLIEYADSRGIILR